MRSIGAWVENSFVFHDLGPVSLQMSARNSMKRGRERHLVYAIVRHAAASDLLRIPVTCKIRIFADSRKTVRFAKMLQDRL